MSKMSTDLPRHALNGPVMGTRWTALLHAPSGFNPEPVRAALQSAVEEVDAQMSAWKPESDLMRVNAAPVNEWVAVPGHLLSVVRLGLQVVIEDYVHTPARKFAALLFNTFFTVAMGAAALYAILKMSFGL